MNNREVERKLADAIAKTAPNDINGVLSRISDEKGTVLEVMKTKNNTKRYLKGAIAACLALAIMSGGGAYYTRACTVSTVVSLDVNPSIELKINSLEKVISCSALNDEAKDVLAEMEGGKDLKGDGYRRGGERINRRACQTRLPRQHILRYPRVG